MEPDNGSAKDEDDGDDAPVINENDEEDGEQSHEYVIYLFFTKVAIEVGHHQLTFLYNLTSDEEGSQLGKVEHEGAASASADSTPISKSPLKKGTK